MGLTPVKTPLARAPGGESPRMCRALLYLLGGPVLLDNLLFQPDSAMVGQSDMPKMLHVPNLAGQDGEGFAHCAHERRGGRPRATLYDLDRGSSPAVASCAPLAASSAPPAAARATVPT